MAQIELSLGDLLILEAELNGFTDPESGERILEGFLKENLPLTAKYYLSKLSEDLKQERTILEKIKQDLIKEHGTMKEDGGISVDMFEDEEKTRINPKFAELQYKYMELLDEKKQIEYSPMNVSILENITSGYNYVMLYKLIEG